MKKIIVSLLAVLSISSFAADSTQTGTITLSGLFAPIAVDVEFALNDCGAGVDLTTCDGTLNAASFAGHTNTASIGLGGLTSDPDNITRYVQFEMRVRGILFKNDYVQVLAGLTSSLNDVSAELSRLSFVSVGGAFGNNTLGDTSGLSLSANERIIDTGEEVTLAALTAAWDQDSDANVDTNNKVVLATTAAPLVFRGILGITFDEDATSSAFNTVVTMGVTFKDN